MFISNIFLEISLCLVLIIWSEIYPLCNDPWPSCFQLLIDRKRSCLVWKFVHKVPIGLSPWYRVQDLRGLLLVHTFHQMLRYNRHWCVQVGDQSLHCKFQWGQYRVHRKWFPRTENNSRQKLKACRYVNLILFMILVIRS